MAMNLEQLYTMLFTAPVRASVMAEKEYRTIWADYLKNVQLLLGNDQGSNKSIIKNALEMAPVMKFSSSIESEVIMRVERISSSEGGLGLQVGAFGVTGRFGREKTEESTIRASAAYELSNNESTTLQDYLENGGVPIKNKGDIDSAIKYLKKDQPD